jgi:hypothetical protein
MNRKDLVDYARRPWAEAASAKASHWVREFRARGPEVTLRAAHGLWLHMARVRRDWPTAQDRERDLEHHLELRRSLDRAARALAGR